MYVKMKHRGQCGLHHYEAGQEIDLPDEVIKALDPADYEVLPQPKKEKDEAKEESKAHDNTSNKQVTGAANK